MFSHIQVTNDEYIECMQRSKFKDILISALTRSVTCRAGYNLTLC